MNLETFLRIGRKIIPEKIFKKLQPIYHLLMAFLSALIYRFPSRKIFVLGVTGTKGKTSTIEIISAILEQAGYKTALASSLRFKTDKDSEKNELKMTMPGRFFMQKFLRKAVKQKCQYVILEMTSEGAIQHRHKFIELNALIFNNLAPEHIESNGSFENYRNAKLKYFKALEKSDKNLKTIIINEDDPNASYFLNFNIDNKIKYGLKNLESYNIKIPQKLMGEFNLYNISAAIAFAKSQNIGMETVKSAIEKFSGIEGRMEEINEGQDFKIIVDYAHTPDSLEKVYETFQTSRKICVLGSAGGGRDKWKRPEMGKIASRHCDQIILTNEDPYDENPAKILDDIEAGFSEIRNSNIEIRNYEKILDRREAIQKSLSYAKTGDAVIITGKGAEPWLMGPKGTKIKWDDREVVREALKQINKAR
ncbi:UDP-N-acetylmuramoyl-L-alanyl-D-glutamate--2,6-diaminopimelate ligase [Patescibacteria group bacterium]|nr:UDP-N-acetylmuramoyl-L-alanyl-D-glutamate--2,6-diaminopimelate ligase [Patescibacteria group bacterium]